MDAEFCCSICLGIAEDAVETNCCHHVFCEACLTSMEGRPCPQCRQKFTIQPSHLARRMIGNFTTQCPNIGCNITLSRSELKQHKEGCKFGVFTCPAPKCPFFGVKSLFAQHLVLVHENEIVNNAKNCFVSGSCSKGASATLDTAADRIATTENEYGRIARLGTTGKFYCQQRLETNCRCCNRHCGPTNGCNCRGCMKLDIKLRTLSPNWYVNREGAACRMSSETNRFYCGRCVMMKNMLCDGYCGPTNGPNCDACRILQDQLETRYAGIW